MLGEGTLSAKDAKKLFAKGRNRKALKKSGLKAPTARSATPGLGSAA